jgi:Leucine-rich repeat (LRR) protein
MKKNLLLILFTAYTAVTMSAQTIPDANFADAIRAVCPTCINSSNVLQPPATTLALLSVNNKLITDLSGIGGFTLLETLDCGANLLTVLPTLPTGLKHLYCASNRLASLPTLPSGLITLHCEGGLFTSLPTLPNTLEDFNCGDGKVTSLPTLPPSLMKLRFYNNKVTTIPTLPASLIWLACSNNLLTSLLTLPSNLTQLACNDNTLMSLPTLPNSLEWLTCSNMSLTTLPSLPASLIVLVCGWNNLTSLPTLPSDLRVLYCNDNQLMTLPSLSATTLFTDLDCSNNNLIVLPALSSLSALVTLYCNNNNLTQIPILPPDLNELICYDNPLTSLPTLPSTLYYLKIDATTTCIPNQVAGLTILDPFDNDLAPLPTCASLPVELLNFDVQNTEGSKNYLTWRTASETNNSHFDIERSTDGTTFHSIGQVKGNNKASSYQFVDNQPFVTTYYRLRQIDFDGTETLSNIVSVVQKGKGKALIIYPNPVSNTLTVENTEEDDEEVGNFQIINLLGQQVLSGKTGQGLDVSALPQGTYVLRVGEEQAKFVKE